MTREPRWKPRKLAGGVFCSPACGGRCKRSAYERAKKESAALALFMGNGWRPVVWENLGWHWRAEKGFRQNGGALLEITPSHEGYVAWFQGRTQFLAQANSPDRALEFVLRKVSNLINELGAELKAAQL